MKTFINEWVVPSIIAVVIVLFLNRFIFILVTVPTGSMETTIMPGDRLYVNKLFDVKDAKRGDIIVFQSDELDARLVKRLIGLPGETVEINENGEVFINGEKIQEPYINQAGGEARTYKIPEGTYFFLGDNRPVSVDARYWSNPYISEDKIIGEAIFRFFPFNRIGKLK
ncbi:MAG: signal peptidase I [Tissierellia bacterium]|jgi:signal peptidase I|nr:signal peptidase I [Tissierellia bacterium]MDD4046862.1 signal peptidase I [Tissierellia bacterium]MDD4678186.1 signal peptidase I [Tissierellia bacterium]